MTIFDQGQGPAMAGDSKSFGKISAITMRRMFFSCANDSPRRHAGYQPNCRIGMDSIHEFERTASADSDHTRMILLRLVSPKRWATLKRWNVRRVGAKKSIQGSVGAYR